MDFKGLDLNLLVALDVLLQEKNITHTGERIHLSQSATSSALARLRSFFSDELLVQIGHKMVLTPLAEDLITPTRELLLQAQAILDRTPRFEPVTSKRKFSIMLSDYVGTVLMPAAIRRIQKEAPAVSVEMVPLIDSPAEALERGDVDFLIIPEINMSSLHPSETLFEDEYACVLWSENREVGETIGLAQYLSMGHVAVLFGRMRSLTFDETFLNRSGNTRRIEVVALDFNQVPQLVIGTSRLATMHRRLASIYTSQLPLRMVDLPVALPPLVEKLQWHQYRDSDPGHRWFRGVLRETAGLLDKNTAAASSTSRKR
ncbi:Nodulation protein D [Candidatus Sulfotelmatobacter sp. SbA7]|nr:Nodulation protein D [Candidatus Sulfotelmatobacter sp. SbA7]